MHRIYEWVRIIFKEKVNAFFKGFTGGSIVSYLFLYNSNFSGKHDILIATVVKIIAIGVGGVISGFANILGTDFYKWAKAKVLKRKTKIKRNNNETKTRVKRAS